MDRNKNVASNKQQHIDVKMESSDAVSSTQNSSNNYYYNVEMISDAEDNVPKLSDIMLPSGRPNRSNNIFYNAEVISNSDDSEIKIEPPDFLSPNCVALNPPSNTFYYADVIHNSEGSEIDTKPTDLVLSNRSTINPSSSTFYYADISDPEDNEIKPNPLDLVSPNQGTQNPSQNLYDAELISDEENTAIPNPADMASNCGAGNSSNSNFELKTQENNPDRRDYTQKRKKSAPQKLVVKKPRENELYEDNDDSSSETEEYNIILSDIAEDVQITDYIKECGVAEKKVQLTYDKGNLKLTFQSIQDYHKVQKKLCENRTKGKNLSFKLSAAAVKSQANMEGNTKDGCNSQGRSDDEDISNKKETTDDLLLHVDPSIYIPEYTAQTSTEHRDYTQKRKTSPPKKLLRKNPNETVLPEAINPSSSEMDEKYIFLSEIPRDMQIKNYFQECEVKGDVGLTSYRLAGLVKLKFHDEQDFNKIHKRLNEDKNKGEKLRFSLPGKYKCIYILRDFHRRQADTL